MSSLERYRALKRARMGVLGSATMGGPDVAQEQQQLRQEQQGISSPAQAAETAATVAAPLDPTASVAGAAMNPLAMGMEMAGMVAGRGIGGYFASRVGRALLPKLVQRLSVSMGHMAGTTGGALAGSEAAASFAEETPEETNARRRNVAIAAATGEATTPLVQHGVTAPLARGGRRLAGVREVDMALPHAREVQTELAKVGGSLSPGQAMGGWVSWLENLGASSILGGGQIEGRRTFGIESAKSLWQKTFARFGQKIPPEMIGKALGDALENTADAHRGLTNAAYRVLESKVTAAGGIPDVDLHPVLAKWRKELHIIASELDPVDPKARNIIRLLESGAPELQQPGQPPQKLPVSFEMANTVRSYLSALARRDDSPIPGTAARAGAAARDIDVAIEAKLLSMGNLGAEVQQASKIARETAGMGKERFNNEIIANMIGRAAPEEVAQLVYTHASPTRINKVYEILHDPQYGNTIRDPDGLWKQIQAGWLTEIEHRAGVGPDDFGGLSGEAIIEEARQARGTFEALFRTPEERRSILISAKALELAQNPAGSKMATLFVGLKQASSLAQVGSLGMIGFGSKGMGGSAAILAVPALISRALAVKGVSNALLRWSETKSTRLGFRSAQLAAYAASRAMVEAGIPHVFRDENGNETQVTTQQPGIPGASKPLSKFQGPVR